MATPPGQQGLSDRLASMERRTAELTRRGISSNAPLCVIRLGTDVTAWDAASTNPSGKDVVPVTSWSATATYDNRDMWRYNTTDGSYAELPCAGRYSISVASKWQKPGVYNSSNPNCVSTSVLLNGSSAVTNGIDEATSYMLPWAATCYTLVCDDQVFAAGDRIRINFWSRYGDVRLLTRTLPNAYTRFVIRYLGPR